MLAQIRLLAFISVHQRFDFVLRLFSISCGDDRISTCACSVLAYLLMSITVVAADTPKPAVYDEVGFWHLSNAEFDGYVSKKTGLLERLSSRKPSRMEIIPNGGRGLTIYVENTDQKWLDELSTIDSVTLDQGIQEGHPFHRLVCKLKASAHNVTQAEVEYRVFDDTIGIRVKVDYLVDDPAQYRVGVYQEFDPQTWPKEQHLFFQSPSAQKEAIRFSFMEGHFNDEQWHTALYPMSMLISEDRYFLWGYLDLGSYVVLNRNFVPNTSPSFMISPIGISQGTSYTFDFIYKTFPKATNTFADVLGWYARRHDNSDPDFNQGPVRLEHDISRTIGYGNMGCWDGRFMALPGANIFEPREKILEAEALMLKNGVRHLWYGGWNNWRETAPSSGEFVSQNLAFKTNAEEIKSEICRLQRKEFKVYLYFRQAWWFTKSDWESEEEMDGPPYKRWLNRTPEGKRVQLWWNKQGGYYPADEERANSFGIYEPIIPGEVDFNNDEARAWYFKRLKECVEYYQPDGIAWDFGWSHLAASYNVSMYSAADPNCDMFQGQLKIQYEVYKWLQENHPEKKVLTNNVGGAPAQLYADAILLEGGTTDPHSAYHDASKALNTAIVNLIYGSASYDKASDPNDPAIEKFYKDRLKVMLPLGASYGCFIGDVVPHTEYQMTEWFGGLNYYPFVSTISTDLTEFSAKTNAVPMVTDDRTLSTNSPEVVGSVWADEKNFMVAIYNNDHKKSDVKVRVDRDILQKYKQSLSPTLPHRSPAKLTAMIINADGKRKSGKIEFTYNIEDDDLLIECDLDHGQLLLMLRE